MPFKPTTAAMTKQSAPSASNTQRPRLLDARISSSVSSGCSGTAGSEVASAISADYTSTPLRPAYASCKPDPYPHQPKTVFIPFKFIAAQPDNPPPILVSPPATHKHLN